MKVTQMNPFAASGGRTPASSPANSASAPRITTPFSEILPLDISSFKKDDWILLGIIAVLIMEGSDDYILLCALGYLFMAGL